MKKIISALLATVGCWAWGLSAAPTWETGQYAPASWRPLEGRNLLAGLDATLAGSYYVESGRCVDGAPLALLTDGNVPGETCDYSKIVGLANNASLAWTFPLPITLDRIRICTRWGDAGRDGIAIASVRVKHSGSSVWSTLVQVPALRYACGGSSGNWEGTGASYATLSDSSGALASDITALQLVFGTQDNNGAGYVEIEAMGSPASPQPILNAFLAGGDASNAVFCAELSWCGQNADAADFYFAMAPAGQTLTPVRIAEGRIEGSRLRHPVDGLQPGTGYAYSIFASNHLGQVSVPVGGTFTTLSGEAQPVRVNEVMAAGEVDWFEICNPNALPVDLSGWRVTDDPSRKTSKWKTLPEGASVPARGFLVVYADGENGCRDGKVHVDLGLSASGESVALATPDGVLVSRLDFPEQFDDISYGCDGALVGSPARYFPTPTPGAANGAGRKGPTPPPTFSVPHGYRSEPFELALSCSELPSAPIYYTLDGTAPTTASARYTSPIRIASTKVVRALVYDPEAVVMRGEVATYIFLDQVLAQSPSTSSPGGGFPGSGAVNNQAMRYGMRRDLVADAAARAKILRGFTNSIATISIAIDPQNLFNASTGIYVNISQRGRAWERVGMVEQIDPVHGAANEFTAPMGLRMRGAASRTASYPKHSFRLFFRAEYGRKTVAFPFFGAEGTDTYRRMDLRCSQNYSWANNPNESYSWMRDAWVTETFERDAQRDLGLPYTRSRYCNLFINGEYWGLYQTQERADEHFAASYLGGDGEDYDAFNVNDLNSGSDAGRVALHDLMAAGFANDANYQRALGNNPDGSRNPDYPVLLDVTNLVLRTLIGHYAADGDSPCSIWGAKPNNYFAICDHTVNSTGFKWFCHDGEHALGMGAGHASEKGLNAGVDCNPVNWGVFSGIGNFNSHWLNHTLMSNPEYRIVWSDMVERHLKGDGELSTAANLRRFRSRMAEIDDAIVGEAARWGRNGQTYDTWTTACEYIVDNFILLRNGYLLGHYRAAGWYRDAPALSVVAPVVDDWLLGMAANATVYYTLDGSDPRLYGGAVASSATAYSGELELGSMRPLVRARSRDAAGNWSALAELDLSKYIPPPPAVAAVKVCSGDGSLDQVLVSFANVDAESRLFMAWGAEDRGDNFGDWENSVCLGAVMPGTTAVKVGAPTVYNAGTADFAYLRFFLSRGTYEGDSSGGIDCIRGDGSQRIDLGYVPTSSTRCQLKFRCSIAHGGQFLGTDDKLWRFFSSRDKGSDSAYIDIVNASSGRIHGNFIPSADAVYEYEVGNLYLKDLSTGTTLMSAASMTMPSGYSQSLQLFSLASAGSYCSGDVYYLKIFEGERLMRDFVPARDANGVVGLRDNCQGRFYSPTAGTFPGGGGVQIVGASAPLAMGGAIWTRGGLETMEGDLRSHLRVAEVMSVPVLGGSDGEEYVVLTNLDAVAELYVGGARVACMKSGDAVAKCDFRLPSGTVIPAGGVLVCKKADFWPGGKITDGSVDVWLRDGKDETVQKLFLSTKWNGTRFRMCDGKGGAFVAVSFAAEVLDESGWRPSIPDFDDASSREAVAASIVQIPALQSWLASLAADAGGASAIAAWRGDADTLTACYLVDAAPETDPEIELRISSIEFDAEGHLEFGAELRQHGVLVERRMLNGGLRLVHTTEIGGEPMETETIELGRSFPVPTESLKLTPPAEGHRHFFRLRIDSSR